VYFLAGPGLGSGKLRTRRIRLQLLSCFSAFHFVRAEQLNSSFLQRLCSASLTQHVSALPFFLRVADRRFG
jgi:hypothetical protein